MPSARARNLNRKTPQAMVFHWLPKPLGVKQTKSNRFKPRNRQRTKKEIAEHEARIDEMIRSSYSVGEILQEINLQSQQLVRHLNNLQKKNPEQAWRYKKLLKDGQKVEAYKMNIVYDLRAEGLTLLEIESLMGLDVANSSRYVRALNQSVNAELKKEMLAGSAVLGGLGSNKALERERLVVRAVYKNAKKSRIVRVRKRAELLLPKFSGMERNRLQVAINTLKELEESAKS